jgi:60 kDa SS-A/Ro ribonucleoprotein
VVLFLLSLPIKVWAALLTNMPMTAMIRNLGKMSAIGLFGASHSDHVQKVCTQLNDESALHRARIHPFTLLQALVTYKKGHGEKGKLKWEVNPRISQALDAAFYLAFKVSLCGCGCVDCGY